MGAHPESRYSEYLKVATIKEIDGVVGGRESIELLLEYFKNLIAQERALIDLAGDAHDDVTADLMTGYLASQEKNVWMLLAYAQHKHHDDSCCCETK